MIKTDNENSKETANFAILGKAQGTDVNAPYYHTLVSTITPLYKNYLKRSGLTGKNLMFNEIAFMLYSAFY